MSSKLSNVVENDFVKKTVNNELVKKVNTISSGGFVLKQHQKIRSGK